MQLKEMPIHGGSEEDYEKEKESPDIKELQPFAATRVKGYNPTTCANILYSGKSDKMHDNIPQDITLMLISYGLLFILMIQEIKPYEDIL